MGAKIPELDLHEKYPHEIESDLRSFVQENFNLEKDTARIIYGGGAGKMKAMVLAVLQEPEMKKIIDKIKVKEGNCLVVFKS